MFHTGDPFRRYPRGSRPGRVRRGSPGRTEQAAADRVRSAAPIGPPTTFAAIGAPGMRSPFISAPLPGVPVVEASSSADAIATSSDRPSRSPGNVPRVICAARRQARLDLPRPVGPASTETWPSGTRSAHIQRGERGVISEALGRSSWRGVPQSIISRTHARRSRLPAPRGSELLSAIRSRRVSPGQSLTIAAAR